MPTARQNLHYILKEEEPIGLADLSPALGLSINQVLNHLEHVRKSVRPPEIFFIIPAKCLSCGYTFKTRTKLKPPGCCPKCRSSHIQDPLYTIKTG